MANAISARPEQPHAKYITFASTLTHDLFRADSMLVAVRAMLCKELDVDTGNAMHIDNLLLEVSEKLNTLAVRIDESWHQYKG